MSARAELQQLFAAALARVEGAAAVERALREDSGPFGSGPLALLAVGKAACPMSEGALRVLGPRVIRADITTVDGAGYALGALPWRVAAHPVPDARSQAAGEGALRFVSALPPGLPLLVLLSGGGSALWSAPVPGLSLADKQRATQALLRGGSDIAGINTVRKHLSRIKGGGLARAAGARPLWTLAVSDVAGDRPDVIASGPTVPDPTTFHDACAVVREAGIAAEIGAPVLAELEAGGRGERPETPKPGDACFAGSRYAVVASLAHALDAAAAAVGTSGQRVCSLGACLYGEARSLAAELAAAVRKARAEGAHWVVAGGEPTVTVRGSGRGGRAQELALAFALAIAGESGITALFAGSDGRDGPTDAAGAFADPSLVARAQAHGLDPAAALRANDSYTLLEATGDLFRVARPTRTNVTDLALVHLAAPRPR